MIQFVVSGQHRPKRPRGAVPDTATPRRPPTEVKASKICEEPKAVVGNGQSRPLISSPAHRVFGGAVPSQAFDHRSSNFCGDAHKTLPIIVRSGHPEIAPRCRSGRPCAYPCGNRGSRTRNPQCESLRRGSLGVYHSERSVSRKGGPVKRPGKRGAMRALTQALKNSSMPSTSTYCPAMSWSQRAHRRPVFRHGACRMTAVGRGRSSPAAPERHGRTAEVTRRGRAGPDTAVVYSLALRTGPPPSHDRRRTRPPVAYDISMLTPVSRSTAALDAAKAE